MDEQDDWRPAPRRCWLWLAAVPLLLAAGFGAQRMGLFAGTAAVYVANVSGHTVTVRGPGGGPLRVADGAVERFEIADLAGELESTDGSGQPVDRVPLSPGTGFRFYNVGGAGCFAVFDVSSFYGHADKPALRVVDRIGAGTRLYVDNVTVLLPPRRSMPRQVAGDVHWIEDMPCVLLDPAEESMLLGRATMVMSQRMKGGQ